MDFAQTLRQPPVMQLEPTFGVGTADIFYPLCQNMCRGTFKFSIGQSGSLLRLKDWRALKESFLSPFTPFQSVQWSIMSIDVGSLRWEAGGRVVLSIARLLPGFPESDAVEYQGRSREGNGRDFRCHKMPRDATKMETETETKWDILRLLRWDDLRCLMNHFWLDLIDLTVQASSWFKLCHKLRWILIFGLLQWS